MQKFTTRIELHHAHSEDYQALHDEMIKQGFSKTIVSDEGVEYQMLPSEYFMAADRTEEEVRDLASNVAKRILTDSEKSYAVFVTGPQGMAWYNLNHTKAD